MSAHERPRGRCLGCRAPGGGFCGGCGADLRDDPWDGRIAGVPEPRVTFEPADLERAA